MTNTYTQSKGNPRSVGYFDEDGNKTETKVGGDPAWRNNNPGNIKWDGIGHQNYFRGTLGAIGSNGTFAIFPTWEDGQKAKLNLFKTGTQYKGLSIEGAMNKYAPSSENDTAGCIKFIRDKTGLDTNK